MAWNQSASGNSAARKPSLSAPFWMKGAIAGLVVVAIGGIAVFLIFGNGEDSTVSLAERKKPTLIEEKTPAAAPVAREQPVTEDALLAERKARAERIKNMTPDERWQYFVDLAKSRPLDLTPRTNQLFRTSTEQIMTMLFSRKLGDPPPKLPTIPLRERVHLAEILIADNPILPTDTERQKNAKELVGLAKKELQTFIREGGEVEDFFDHYQGQLYQAHSEWMESQKSLMKVIKEEPDIAGEYAIQLNERLAKKGIKPLLISPKFKAKLGLE